MTNGYLGLFVVIRIIRKQKYIPPPIKFSDTEKVQTKAELQRFLECKIIEPVHTSDQDEPVHTSDQDEYISNIFTRTKKDKQEGLKALNHSPE